MLLITSLLLVTGFCDDKKIFSTAINVNRNGETPAETSTFVRNNVNYFNHREKAAGDNLEGPKNIETAFAAVLTKPASRAYNFFLKNNIDYNLFKSNNIVGMIIGPPGFPENGPKNGKIASYDNPFHDTLDQYSTGRWSPSYLKLEKYNATHFVSEIIWTINDKASIVDTIKVFLSNSNYTDDLPIQGSMFNLVCSYRSSDDKYTRSQRDDQHTKDIVRFDCYIEIDFIKDLLYGVRGFGILVSTLKIIGEDYAFYQVADISLHESAERITNYHGFVSYPPSRAKLCQLRVNINCGSIMYEPQSVEGLQGFPDDLDNPPDGKIASGNNWRFNKLNKYGTNRWSSVEFPEISCYNETHVYFNLTWQLTATHSSNDMRVYLSNEKYTSAEPLSRRHLDLDPICSIEFYKNRPPLSVTILCPITLEKYNQLLQFKELLLLSVWNIADTPYAFYQVVDLQALPKEQSVENISNKCR